MKRLHLYGHLASKSDLFKHIQNSKEMTGHTTKYKVIKKYSGMLHKVRFLDIGCQMGDFIYQLSKEPNISYMKGIDIEKEYIDLGNKYFINDIPKAELKVQNLFDIKERYNIVFMSEVIEHVDNPLNYIKKIYEIMEPGGYFIITTPSALGITNILLNIKHWKNLNYIEKEKKGIGTETDHYYCWDKLTLFRLCNSAGFKYVDHHITRKFQLFNGQSIILIVRK